MNELFLPIDTYLLKWTKKIAAKFPLSIYACFGVMVASFAVINERVYRKIDPIVAVLLLIVFFALCRLWLKKFLFPTPSPSTDTLDPAQARITEIRNFGLWILFSILLSHFSIFFAAWLFVFQLSYIAFIYFGSCLNDSAKPSQ